ncbi:MAG TPA: SIMPL domain-containing protein [Stellaceae bacterium]|nr:SIMPL domain-containing protein [Stellaceae bacterium]
MRHWLLVPVLVLAAAGPALADPPAPTVLHLTQTAEKKLTRDVLHVELRAEKTGSDAQTVQSAINQQMAKALEQAHRAQGIEVETGSYSVNHIETQSEWSGFQSLYLSGGDAAAVLKLAGALQGQGLVMSTMGYEASHKVLNGAQDELTSEALADLDKRAAAIARQMRLSVVGYRNLDVGNAQTQGAPMPRFAAMAAGAVAGIPPPVAAPGEATVSVTVNADILLGQKQP